MYIHSYLCLCLLVDTFLCMFAYTFLCMFLCMHLCINERSYVSTFVCICLPSYVCLYIRLRVCTFICEYPRLVCHLHHRWLEPQNCLETCEDFSSFEAKIFVDLRLDKDRVSHHGHIQDLFQATRQCDPDGQIVCLILAIFNNENFPNSVMDLPKWLQKFAKCQVIKH